MDVLAFCSHYLPPIACGGTLCWLAWKSNKEFIQPSKILKRELTEAIKNLKELRHGASGQPVTDLAVIADKVMTGEVLRHLWSEYQETLHPQKGIDTDGFERIVRYRSTALSETFFTDQALVDTPLKTAFFKHLPGILTGIGIIGTFFGLITGLKSFEVSANADLVRKSLSGLLSSVGDAFTVSLMAIASAMIFTFIEKTAVTQCYGHVEELTQLIDSLFDAGAGEEYLSRLVAASETSATQATQLKDALVSEFKQIMAEVTELQVSAAAKHSSAMSSAIVESFTESISEPMERISRAVDNVGTNQGDAVNRLLTDVLANFSSQMEGIFGGQLRGINELLIQTTETMQGVSSRFETVAAGVQTAGESAADAMAEKLSQAISSIEARQEIMNAQMGEFVVQIKNLVHESQTETSQKMQGILADLGEKVSGMVTQLEEQSRESTKLHQTSQIQFAETTNATVDGIGGMVQALAEEVQSASDAMRQSVSSLSQSSRESIDKLNSGAEVLYMASSEFAKAGKGVTDTVRESGRAVETITGATNLLGAIVKDVRSILSENERAKDTFGAMVNDLRSLVENAKREASMSEEVIASIRHAAEQLSSAGQQAEDYLRGVTEVLGNAHVEFARNIERTLNHGNTTFQKELSMGVGLLNIAIKELGDTIDEFPRGNA
uniref:MotA/TolQ/ExbB proton channel domain-containing protein n=1 Tax=Geobacter sp. (strain M21) TaxID=443144 RepID=C6E2C4_GEOSM